MIRIEGRNLSDWGSLIDLSILSVLIHSLYKMDKHIFVGKILFTSTYFRLSTKNLWNRFLFLGDTYAFLIRQDSWVGCCWSYRSKRWSSYFTSDMNKFITERSGGWWDPCTSVANSCQKIQYNSCQWSTPE